MKRSLKDYIIISLKGMGMGAADVVPGVSGGTIAFISGIYEELIDSIKSIDLSLLPDLKKFDLVSIWKKINGNFLTAVFAGIAVSIVSLSKLITFLLDTYPVLVWAFFFGLVVASSIMIAKKIKEWNISSIISLLVGIAIAFYITVASPAETPTDLWFIFLSGVIAICAMILPGISGSFILLLLGKYSYIFGAISEMNFKVIGTFIAGCAVGITSFSHLVSWMFKKFHNQTIAILTGFMIGSLNKVWPWKHTIETRINSHGKEVPFLQESVLPTNYTEGDSFIIAGIALMIVAIVIIWALDKVDKTSNETI